ncbi:unnamed protein product [Linum trigynum]|uniref:F-box domain-containing protein n=1 Tax=Linum trigynum TaxID=586398 RepID=A0AAV2D6W6_9ROSI
MATGNYHRKRLTSTSLSPISKLGDDLLIELLIRLPNPKSIFRSKPVCKRLNSLISTPYFARRLVYHRRQILSAGEIEPPLLIASDAQGPVCSFLPPVKSEVRSILDCNKDLLLIGVEESMKDAESGRRFLVCNPFSKQWVVIPLAPPMLTSRQGRWTARLVCEPCNSITLDLGDAEEAITHHSDYRFCVVRMFELESGITVFQVFRSNSEEWLGSIAFSYGIAPHWNPHNVAVSLNGRLYWENGLGQFFEWNPFLLHSDDDDDDDDERKPTLTDAYGFKPGSSLWVSQGGKKWSWLLIRLIVINRINWCSTL